LKSTLLRPLDGTLVPERILETMLLETENIGEDWYTFVIMFRPF
jgi:hypothetical protein